MSMQLLTSAVTLVISLMLILFFRQTDKNNRSIEKAKKYGDRVKDEIEGFVNERTQNLRDAAIELDAKLSQAIAAVNKLDSIYKKVRCTDFPFIFNRRDRKNSCRSRAND